MIPLDQMIHTIPKALCEHLGIQRIVMSSQTAEPPKYPYGQYTITTIASGNNGTWQQHEDGIDRKLVRSIWSFTFLSGDWEESVSLAVRAREWFEHSGRTWLKDHGITVQQTTDITNRDNILTVEYERKNGFDVVFYVFDEAENPAESTGTIKGASIAHEVMT